MELPRDEMDLSMLGVQTVPETSVAGDEAHYSQLGPEDDWAMPDSEAFDDLGLAPRVDEHAPSTGHTIHLTTAAALANGGQPALSTDANAFSQGMWVLHATFGLGQIIALSGSAEHRMAIIDFPAPSGRQKVVLASGTLQPVGVSPQ